MQPVAFRTVSLPPVPRADNSARPQETPSAGSAQPVTLPATASDIAVSKTASLPSAATDRRPSIFAASFSAADLEALQATEHGKAENSPAAQARAAIADNPELADAPFGRIVSQIARGETPVVPPEEESAATDAPTPPAPENTSEPPAADAGSPPAADSTANADTGAAPGDEPTGSTDATPNTTPSDGTTTDAGPAAPPSNVDVASDIAPALGDIDPEQTLLDALSS